MLRIFISSLLLVIINVTYSQNLMVNGGFETYDANANDFYDFSINYALGWQNLNNTCDLAHPSTSLFGGSSHSPRTGDANARFGFPPNAEQEYFYGQTNNLVAGEQYRVSFWVRKDYTTSQNIPVGLHIGASIPSPQQITPYVQTTVPQVRVTPFSTDYIEASFCFTPATSGIHYVTIGAFGENTTNESQLFLVDDVTVDLLDANDVLSNAQITGNQSVYCVGDDVILDGSSSTDELQHRWSLYVLNNGTEQLISQQSVQNGPAGQITISNFFGFGNPLPQAGKCYRAYLTTYNSCFSQDFIEFCYAEDPNVDFLNNENAVCEGEVINLEVTGDNGWTYDWSTGDSGVGLKNITVTPTGNSATYSVTVTTPNGCTATESITFTVHSQNNVAPWMNGINGSGEYTMYVNADPGPTDQISFTSGIFNDNQVEIVSTYQPTSFNFPASASNFYSLSVTQTQLSFQWNYGSGFVPDVQPGEYSFTVFLKDDNQCNEGKKEFTFTIIVICENCPECVSYENRSSSTTPLPPETKAAKCIKAGWSQTVDTEDEYVYFQAGVEIDLGPYFNFGPGYEGVIEPTTCVTDCHDCCVDWDGFTHDDIANGQINHPQYGVTDVYRMDFNDNDPTNDIFQVTDIYHPYCAYGAFSYELEIFDQTNSEFHSSSSYSSTCCNYVSPSPDNPIPHASIWWDGYTDNIFGNPVRPNTGTLFYTLKLFGCNGAIEEEHGYIMIGGPTLELGINDDDLSRLPSELRGPIEDGTLQNSIEKKAALEREVHLSPNPTTSKVNISGVAANDISNVKIYDDKGIIVQYEKEVRNGQVNVETLKPGTYYCKIKAKGLTVTKKFVKL